MTYQEIQSTISTDFSSLSARHLAEVRELRDQHRDERSALDARHADERRETNAKHQMMWADYRGGTSDPAARVIAHNEKIRASNLSVKLRTQFGFVGITNAELVDEIKIRLDKLSLEYKNYGADPVEHKRLEKRERDFRAAIVTLGGSLEGVKRISWRYDEQLWSNSPDRETESTRTSDEEMDALLNQTPQFVESKGKSFRTP
jgi:hypothetical protein